MNLTFRALATHNYRLFAGGSVVSNVGTWMQRAAQDWLVLLLTGGSGTALGITTGLQFLPILLLSTYAGVIADRVPKQRLLQFTQLMMAGPALLLGVLALTGAVQTWHVYVLAFVFGVGRAFDGPPRKSFVSELVDREDVPNAVALSSASFNLARIIGPALAGFLIAALGNDVSATGAVIVLNGLSYGAVVVALQRMRLADLDTPEPTSRREGMIRDGFRYVRGRPDLLMILAIVFFAGTFGFNFQMTSALMATEVFHKGASEYGVLGSAMAVGSLTGALLAARRVHTRHRVVVLSGLAFGVAEMVAALLPSYLAFAVWLPVVGVAAITMTNAANSTLQLSVSPAMRGRVMALYMMIFMGGKPLGAPFIGWVGSVFGAPATLLVGGGITIAGVLVAAFWFSRSQGLLHAEPRKSSGRAAGKSPALAHQRREATRPAS